MFFDVRYRFRAKGAEEVEEKVFRIENAKGAASSMKDLAMACYKVFARRDIDVITVEAVMYVPKLLAVEINDEGLVTIDGRPIDPAVEYSESEMSPASFAAVLPVAIPAQPQQQFVQQAAPQPPLPVRFAEPSQRTAPVHTSGDQRVELVLDDREKAKLDVGETRWKPSPSEQAEGWRMVCMYEPARAVVFDPPGDHNSYALPIAPKSLHYVSEKVFRQGVRDGFYRIDLEQGHMMLPESLFVDAPARRSDGILDIQAERPDTQTMVGDATGRAREEVLNHVPLQRADDRGPRRAPQGAPQGMPVVGPGGIVHGLDDIDIRAGRQG